MIILLSVILIGVYLVIGLYTSANFTWCFGYVNNKKMQLITAIGLIFLFPLFYIWLVSVIVIDTTKGLWRLYKK